GAVAQLAGAGRPAGRERQPRRARRRARLQARRRHLPVRRPRRRRLGRHRDRRRRARAARGRGRRGPDHQSRDRRGAAPRRHRVRALMAERELDALVVRAPDNVLYLTDYWCMKGYDLAVFPREGEPTLVVLEPQAEEAERAWAGEVRLFAGYDERDPRPPTTRAVEAAQAVVRERGYERIGLELSLGTQASDRMVGEPTTYTHEFFHALGEGEDATALR